MMARSEQIDPAAHEILNMVANAEIVTQTNLRTPRIEDRQISSPNNRAFRRVKAGIGKRSFHDRGKEM
jgi:hypothetical protein